jgi:hypothetical protein
VTLLLLLSLGLAPPSFTGTSQAARTAGSKQSCKAAATETSHA